MKKIRLIGLLLLSILLSLPNLSNAQVGSDSGSGAIVIGSRNSSGGSAVITGGTCTNSVVTAIGPTGVPTCTASPNATSYRAGDGTAAAPSFSFTNFTNKGFYSPGTNGIGVSIGGNNLYLYNLSTYAFGSAQTLSWATGADPSAVGGDIFLRRSAAKTLTIDTDSAGGLLTDIFLVGRTQITGSLLASSDVRVGAASFLFFNTRTAISSSADGMFQITNNAVTAGIGADVSSDSTIWFKTRALGDNAIVKANTFTFTGTISGSSGTTTVGTSAVQSSAFNNTNVTNGGNISALQSLTELTTIAAAATTDTTIQMPAGAVVLAVSVRVTTVIPTCTTFTVGDSGSAARFSTTTVSCAATSTDAGTKAGAYYNAGALSIRITPNATPANNSGRLRVTIYYYTVTPPTS